MVGVTAFPAYLRGVRHGLCLRSNMSCYPDIHQLYDEFFNRSCSAWSLTVTQSFRGFVKMKRKSDQPSQQTPPLQLGSPGIPLFRSFASIDAAIKDEDGSHTEMPGFVPCENGFSNSASPSESRGELVIGIDFGTTFTGVAYAHSRKISSVSSASDRRKAAEQILVVQAWPSPTDSCAASSLPAPPEQGRRGTRSRKPDAGSPCLTRCRDPCRIVAVWGCSARPRHHRWSCC